MFLLIGPLMVNGQKKKQSLDKYKSISRRNLKLDRSVSELLEDARQQMEFDNYGALDLVEEALALSITEDNKLDEARSYILLGEINQDIEEWELSVEIFQLAIRKLESQYTATKEYVEALNGLIKAYEYLEQYDKAILNLDKKLSVVTSNELKTGTYLDLAEVYLKSGNYDRAENAMKYGDAIIKEFGLKGQKVRSQAIRARLLAQMDKIDAAEDIYQQSQSFSLELDSTDITNNENHATLEETRKELLNAYSRQNRVTDEINLRNQSIQQNREKGLTKKVSREKVALSKTLIDAGNTNEAIKELEDAAVLATKGNDLEERASAYEALADAYYKSGNSARSLESYRRFRDAVNELEQQRSVNQQRKEGFLKKQQEIFSLSNELALDEREFELQENQLALQQLVIYGLLLLLIGAFISVYFILKNARKTKTMSELLALKSLRSQMNPHFIFNALNSVNQFIAISDERAANKFLSDFSKLMRLVLDNSQEDFITLEEERTILDLYLKLEHNRFRDKFDYTFEVDKSIALDSIEIPPMLLQPYVENAIWHGLRYKKEKGKLNVRFVDEEGSVQIIIEDDGIGRKQSAALKTENQKSHRSTGLRNTRERIDIINRVYHKGYHVVVEDLYPDHGTRVTLQLPQNGVIE